MLVGRAGERRHVRHAREPLEVQLGEPCTTCVHLVEPRQLVNEALHLARVRFDRRGEAIALSQLASVDVADEKLSAASESFREALKLF